MRDRLIAVLGIVVVFVLMLWAAAGCSSIEVQTPDGLTFRSERFLMSSGMQSATVNPQTGDVSVEGYQSDANRALDIADKLADRIP